jgi:uncharacterized protein (TIGR02145 family)
MKKTLFILVIFILMIACGQTKNKWIKAKQANSVVEVSQFLKENPGSEFENEAIRFLDSTELATAKQSNSIVEIKKFLKNKPNSDFNTDAKNFLYSLEWINALNVNSIEQYTLFIDSFPSSKYIAEAKMNIDILETGTFRDSRDGKVCKIFKIGKQTWLGQNLAYKSSSGCWAYGNNENNVSIYGYLYNWETAKTACPSGWHLSTVDEWRTLIASMGGESIAGGRLKEKGTKSLGNKNDVLNNTGFAALPGGIRNSDGSYGMLEGIGSWWSISNDASSNAWNWTIIDNNISESNLNSIQNGFSVRCVKD